MGQSRRNDSSEIAIEFERGYTQRRDTVMHSGSRLTRIKERGGPLYCRAAYYGN